MLLPVAHIFNKIVSVFNTYTSLHLLHMPGILIALNYSRFSVVTRGLERVVYYKIITEISTYPLVLGAASQYLVGFLECNSRNCM